MDGTALFIVGFLLFVTVAALALACIIVAGHNGRALRVLSESLDKMADRVVIEHDEQLARRKLEVEMELGRDYNRTMRENARYNGTQRPAPNAPAADILIEKEIDED